MYLKTKIFPLHLEAIFSPLSWTFHYSCHFLREIQYVEVLKRSKSNCNPMFKKEKHPPSPNKMSPIAFANRTLT